MKSKKLIKQETVKTMYELPGGDDNGGTGGSGGMGSGGEGGEGGGGKL